VERGAGARLPEALDTSTPNIARMHHYFLGGRETFQADRAAAERALAALPAMRTSAIASRQFLRRAVTFLAAEAGVDQFLDIGPGLPARGAVHEVAHEINAAVRVAYVDYDPIVVSHGNAMLGQSDLSIVVQADLRDPDALLKVPAIGDHLDFSRPVALLLLAILHFVSDDDGPARIVARLRDALAPGSYLALTHVSPDLVDDKEAARRAVAAYDKANARAWPRGREQILRFFDGFELVEPGLVRKSRWRPLPGDPAADLPDISWAGIGRKL
jgi:O-methyltransferase involved in polyketide biosynthesis